jgi:hypothetical protein
MRKWLLIWLASLIGVAGMTSVWMRAQAPSPAETVVSGSDLGFRVEGTGNNAVFGSLVVRVNGRWVPAKFGTLPAGRSPVEPR